MRVSLFFHYSVKWLIRLSVALFFIGVPLVVWYLRTEGIGFGFKEKLAETLSGPSFVVSIDKVSVDPFKGLIAEKIRIVRRDGGRELAKISRLVVSVNLSKLLARKVAVESLYTRGASISIPVAMDAGSPSVKVTDVHAGVIFLPGQMRVSRLDGVVEGVRVNISGDFLNPQEFHSGSPPVLAHPAKSRSQAKPPSGLVAELLKETALLRFPEGPPLLTAVVTGDISNFQSLEAQTLRFDSGPIVAPKWEIKNLNIDGAYSDGVLKIRRVAAQDDFGHLTASGEYTVSDRTLAFDAFSSLLPTPFLRLTFPPSFSDRFQFLENPRLSVHTSIDFSQPKPALSLEGSLRAGRWRVDDTKFDSLSLDWVWRDGKFYARNIHAEIGGNGVDADVLLTPGDNRLSLTSNISPAALSGLFGLLGDKTRKALDTFEFKSPPHIVLSIQSPVVNFYSATGSGSLDFGQTAMRGSWMDSLHAKIGIAKGLVTFSDIHVQKGDGVATGIVVFDQAAQLVHLSGVHSTLVPHDILMWVDPKIAASVEPYKFHGAPILDVQGVAHLKNPKGNDLSIHLDAPQGMDYVLLGKTLDVGATVADVGITGAEVDANIKRAKLFNGLLGVRARVSIDPANPVYSADITIDKINFLDLTKLYFNYQTSRGRMSATYHFDTHMLDEKNMTGYGTIRIEGGSVLAIPCLGLLSVLMNDVIPGAGYQTAKLASADFKVADQKVTTKALTVESADFNLLGYGNIEFMTGQMDMNVRINARGVPGMLLWPVSKLFEYESTGTIRDPGWRPKIIPRFGGGEAPPAAPASVPGQNSSLQNGKVH